MSVPRPARDKDLRRLADEFGLAGLPDEHLPDLAAAADAAAAWRAGLPDEPGPEVEPVHVFRVERDR